MSIGCDKCSYINGESCCLKSLRKRTEVIGDDYAIKREFEHIAKSIENIELRKSLAGGGKDAGK